MHSRYSIPHPSHPRAAHQRAAWLLADNIHAAPVVLLVCGVREWPERMPVARRSGRAPPPYESLMPCVQNMLLACRALGLGACLTMRHAAFEEALCHYLEIPDEIGIAVAMPIGFPAEPFGEVARRPARDVTYYDRWNARLRRPRAGEDPPA